MTVSFLALPSNLKVGVQALENDFDNFENMYTFYDMSIVTTDKRRLTYNYRQVGQEIELVGPFESKIDDKCYSAMQNFIKEKVLDNSKSDPLLKISGQNHY